MLPLVCLVRQAPTLVLALQHAVPAQLAFLGIPAASLHLHALVRALLHLEPTAQLAPLRLMQRLTVHLVLTALLAPQLFAQLAFSGILVASRHLHAQVPVLLHQELIAQQAQSHPMPLSSARLEHSVLAALQLMCLASL